MKTQRLIGLLVTGLLSGCAQDRAQPASQNIGQPANSTAVGQTATFSAVASTNGGAFAYQWVFNGANDGGVTNR